MNRKHWIIAVAALLAVSFAVAQSIEQAQMVTVRARPKAVNIFMGPAEQSTTVGDTVRYNVEARDQNGNRIAALPVRWEITDSLNQADTSVVAFRQVNDSSALVLIKAPGLARVKAFTR